MFKQIYSEINFQIEQKRNPFVYFIFSSCFSIITLFALCFLPSVTFVANDELSKVSNKILIKVNKNLKSRGQIKKQQISIILMRNDIFRLFSWQIQIAAPTASSSSSNNNIMIVIIFNNKRLVIMRMPLVYTCRLCICFV